MMKKFFFATLLTMGIVSCSSEKKQIAVPTLSPDAITLADSTTTVIWLKDNLGDKLMPRNLFPGASDSLMEELSLTGGVPSSISTFLMHADGDWILFDTGLGLDHGGQLLTGLQKLNLTADSIDYIYLTHFHGDHIGGMIHEGKPVFQNAQVYACCHEYMAWMTEMPSEQAKFQHEVMDAYRDQIHLFEWGDTLTHQLVAMAAPGHTPGHTVFRKENLLIIGDLMHGAALQMQHPDINSNYDMDPLGAAASRKRILALTQNEGLTLAGMHLPEPAFIDQQPVVADSTGFIVRVGDFAPDFTCTLDDGQQIRLSDLRGKIVMLQFTASWCGVCRKEMPFIESDIWLRHQADNFYLVGIDRDEPVETLQKVRKATGITYPLALDPGANIYCKYALRNSGITRNVLIDKDGRIIKLTRLYNTEEFESLVKMIDEKTGI